MHNTTYYCYRHDFSHKIVEMTQFTYFDHSVEIILPSLSGLYTINTHTILSKRCIRVYRIKYIIKFIYYNQKTSFYVLHHEWKFTSTNYWMHKFITNIYRWHLIAICLPIEMKIVGKRITFRQRTIFLWIFSLIYWL